MGSEEVVKRFYKVMVIMRVRTTKGGKMYFLIGAPGGDDEIVDIFVELTEEGCVPYMISYMSTSGDPGFSDYPTLFSINDGMVSVIAEGPEEIRKWMRENQR